MVTTVSSRQYFRDVTRLCLIMFENVPLDEDTIRHGLDLLFLLHEEFNYVTKGYFLQGPTIHAKLICVRYLI